MTAVRQPCVTDLQLEAWHELQEAKHAVNKRDDAANRAKLQAARAALDELLDAANDCE